MRSILIVSNGFQLPQAIMENLPVRRDFGKINIYYCNRIDLKITDLNGQIRITDGILNESVNGLITKNFFSEYDHIDGQFTLLDISETGEITVATDFINIQRYAYFTHPELGFVISNNIDLILDVLQHNRKSLFSENVSLVDPVGILEQLGYQYTTFTDRTLIRDVRFFPNGTVFKIYHDGVHPLAKDVVRKNKKKVAVSDFQRLLTDNADIYARTFNSFAFPTSGGVDSRITLHSFRNIIFSDNAHLFTHGEPEDIEVKIASRLSDLLKTGFTTFSIQDLYPDEQIIGAYLRNGWNWVLGKWIPVIEKLKSAPFLSPDTLVVFGDTLDLLRAKNIKSIRSRKNRIKIQLGLIDLNASSFTVDDAVRYYQKQIIDSMCKTFELYRPLFDSLGVPLDELIRQVHADLEQTISHVKDLFLPSNGYEFDEAFNLINWGRGTMGNQSRLINQSFPCYIVSGNRKYVKFLYSVNFTERFEDRLVHKLLKKSKLSSIPTAQIPIIPFKYPQYIKYAFWAFRSMIDQLYMKIGRKLGLKKNRLFTIQNWQVIYADKVNIQHYKSYFNGIDQLMNYPLEYYHNRAVGKSRPLGDIDLTNAAQVALILRKLGVKNAVR